MRKIIALFVLSLFSAAALQAQTVPANPVRYIDVTGNSEIEVEPDEIILSLQIKEYWEEEFARKAKPEDYKTKVPLDRIEKDLIAALIRSGVKKENISVQGVGDFWREQGKDFLVGKHFQVRVYDFGTVNEIIRNVDTRGIRSMNIDDLKNKDIAQYREKGKIEALKAARYKAGYLLEALGKKVGEVIAVEEPVEDGLYGTPRYNHSNVVVTESISFDTVGKGIAEVVKIKLSYQMRARFLIAD